MSISRYVHLQPSSLNAPCGQRVQSADTCFHVRNLVINIVRLQQSIQVPPTNVTKWVVEQNSLVHAEMCTGILVGCIPLLAPIFSVDRFNSPPSPGGPDRPSTLFKALRCKVLRLSDPDNLEQSDSFPLSPARKMQQAKDPLDLTLRKKECSLDTSSVGKTFLHLENESQEEFLIADALERGRALYAVDAGGLDPQERRQRAMEQSVVPSTPCLTRNMDMIQVRRDLDSYPSLRGERPKGTKIARAST